MKLHWQLVLLGLLPVPTFADPVADLDQALGRLRAHSNYTWKTTVLPADVSVEVTTFTFPAPETPDGVRSKKKVEALPIEGSTDRLLGTVMRASLDRTPHKTFGTMRAVILHGKGAAEMPDSWVEAAEIAQSIATLPTIDPRNLDHESFLKFYSLQTGRMLLTLQTPADELDRLLAGSNPPMQAGSLLVATLDSATAKKFVFDLRYRDGSSTMEVMPNSAEGHVTIWLKNGEIEKYEVVVDIDIATNPFSATNDRGHGIRLVKTTALAKFDRTEVKIPPKALAKLADVGR